MKSAHFLLLIFPVHRKSNEIILSAADDATDICHRFRDRLLADFQLIGDVSLKSVRGKIAERAQKLGCRIKWEATIVFHLGKIVLETINQRIDSPPVESKKLVQFLVTVLLQWIFAQFVDPPLPVRGQQRKVQIHFLLSKNCEKHNNNKKYKNEKVKK